MTTPTHDHTHAAAPTPVRAFVVDRVWAALQELDTAAFALGPLPHTAEGWATRSTALALISARRAGWWRVLLVADQHTGTHALYRRAVYAAHRRAQSDARFWRETASDWRARTEKRPTSDAAGALSNWAELEVTG